MYRHILLLVFIPLFLLNYVGADNKDKTKRNLDYLSFEFEHYFLEERMNNIFPEGAIFAHALYGLSWCNMISDSTYESYFYKKATTESIKAYNALKQEHVRKQFYNEAIPAFGIFYCGWKNYLLANICKTNNKHELHTELIKNSKEIIKAYNQNNILFLESYPGAIWPADNLSAIASIKICNELHPTKEFEIFLKNWTTKLKEKYKDIEALIPHASNGYGKTITPARGSSMSLMLIFLYDIDREYGKALYSQYIKDFKKHGVISGIREYKRGENGFGDIDSGPVIGGIGFSATIVGIGTCELYGDYNNSKRILAQADIFETKDKNGRKRYLMGKFPMGDLFIIWAETMKYRL